MDLKTIKFTDKHAGTMRPREFGNDVRRGLAERIKEEFKPIKIENEDPAMRFRVTDGTNQGFIVDIHRIYEVGERYHFQIGARRCPHLDKRLSHVMNLYLTERGLKFEG